MHIKVSYTEKAGNLSRTVDILIPVAIGAQIELEGLPATTFNKSELAESEKLANEIKPYKGPAEGVVGVTEVLDANAAFGTTNGSPEEAFGDAGNVVPSTADAAQLQTAPVGTQENTSTQTQAPAVAPVVPIAANGSAPAVAPLMSHVTGAELDSEKLPWDARIHAETRSIVKDGSWKLKRGVDKTVVEAVKAELRQLMAIPSPVAQTALAAPVVPLAPAPTPSPAAPVVPIQAAAPNLFAVLLTQITAKTTAGQLTNEQVLHALQTAGLPNLPSLAQRQDLVPTVATLLAIDL